MNETHPKSCRCAFHVCLRHLRYVSPESHPLYNEFKREAKATIKIANLESSRGGSSEPDHLYDIVVEWSDLSLALKAVKEPFLWTAGTLRLLEEDTGRIHTQLRVRFEPEWQQADAKRRREHAPSLIEENESTPQSQWVASCPCGWREDYFDAEDGRRAIGSHWSPLREVLEWCAAAMEVNLGEDFGQRLGLVLLDTLRRGKHAEDPPPHQRVVVRMPVPTGG